MKASTSHCAIIKTKLVNSGWTNTPECNQDGFKVDGVVNGVGVTICVLDILLSIRSKYDNIDDISIQVITDFIEERQREGDQSTIR